MNNILKKSLSKAASKTDDKTVFCSFQMIGKKAQRLTMKLNYQFLNYFLTWQTDIAASSAESSRSKIFYIGVWLRRNE